ncbi:MAG TPA: hypothetical protein VF662_06675 [Allosphingosinicella sp.]|jgi:hypothetical protein
MEHVNDDSGLQRPLIQILVPDLRTIDQPGTRYAWLNGYCLLSCNTDDLTVSGEVRIGEHLAENPDLIADLAHALVPTAVLAGTDLTAMVSGLGRLPFDAPNQAPSLALLAKLRSMIEHNPPIDLGEIDGDDLDSLNARLLAEMLADKAGACLEAMSHRTLPEGSHADLYAAWQKWRENLVPVLPEREVCRY